MRVCSGAGCLRAVPDGTRFCAECQPVVLADDIKQHNVSDRERYARLYTGQRWNKGIRLRVLAKYPMCDRCDCRVSEIVDHRVPAGVAIQQARDSGLYPFDRYAGFYLLSNLHGLCWKCHAAKTLEDKTHVGPWPNVVEIEKRAPKKVWTF